MPFIEKARKVIEERYTGRCYIYSKQSVRDSNTKLTKMDWVKENEDAIPCRLSFKSKNVTESHTNAAAKVQQIELFLAPEITIKPGSKIEVTQNGVTEKYKHSGVPAVYLTHQEIILEKDGEWA